MSALSTEQLQIYRETARQRQALTRQQLLQRQQYGWQVAHQAAGLLKVKFGAQKVVLFGS
jgi:uncharacterized protein